jgi:hypothetical protein
MNLEKKTISLDDKIAEIKEVESEMEVKNAIEESEIETITEAVKDGILFDERNKDVEADAEMEKAVQDLELNLEVKERREGIEKIAEYSKEIYTIGKDYEMVYSHFEPAGADGEREFGQEMDLFLEGRRKGENYQPVFTYPEMSKQSVEELKKKVADLEAIEARVNNEENEYVKSIILEMNAVIKAKISILIEILNGDSRKAFENAKTAYGDIDDELCRNAQEWHERKIEYLKGKKEKGVIKSEIEKKLDENEFDAEDIKAYFDMAIDMGKLRYNGLEVVIDDDIGSIDVRPSDQNYDHPVVLIARKRKVKGIKLLELIAHEIGNHVTQNHFNYKLGFGGASFGKDWESLQEGFAMRNEAGIKKEIIGESYADFEVQSGSYYILAMKKFKEGADIGEVYDYIFDLKKEEAVAKGEKGDDVDKKADEGAKTVLKRVTRGMYPYYFPKDMAYFKGEFMAKKMEEVGVEKFALQARIDPALIVYMIKAGIYLRSYAYEKGLEAATNVAKKMWEYNGWPMEYLKDKKWFAKDFMKNKEYENMQMDRYVAYRKEFMDKYIRDEMQNF